MHRTYGLFNGPHLIAISIDKQSLINRRNKMTPTVRKHTMIAEKLIYGDLKSDQTHWMFSMNEEELIC